MKTETIRPYKWSSWDCEIWTRGNDKAYIFGEQKWADIKIEGEYALIPIQFHSELSWCDPKDFMLDDKDKTDLVFVINGQSHTLEADDVYYNVQFRSDPMREVEIYEEYTELSSKCDYDGEHELLEELGYEQADGYHIIKLYQRKLGE
jgi:hypothetical protein